MTTAVKCHPIKYIEITNSLYSQWVRVSGSGTEELVVLFHARHAADYLASDVKAQRQR